MSKQYNKYTYGARFSPQADIFAIKTIFVINIIFDYNDILSLLLFILEIKKIWVPD